MNVKIQNRNLDLSRHLRNLIDRKAAKARRMLPSYRSHDLDLHVALQQLSRAKQFQTVLVLTTPQTAIRVEDIEDTAIHSIVRAFDELLRKIKKFKSQLNRERYWQRQPARSGAISSPNNLEEVEQIISANLDKVENYVRRELFHRSLIEHFPPGMIQPQALVDEVFLRVTAQFVSKPDNVSYEQWMFHLAREAVNRKIDELDSKREQLHIEEPSEKEADWEDELLNFYQPDEALRLEDLISDKKATTPEQLLQKEETEEQVQKIVAQLPRAVRESFVLFALEGFNSDEVAMITGKNPEQVIRDVETARGELKRYFVAG